MQNTIRVRKPFAASFVVLVIIAASLGLAPVKLPEYKQSDKVLHAVTFFLLTVNFYWILETSRRRLTHLTLAVCVAGLGVGSEVLQGLLPNGREFDIYDIAANTVGTVPGLFLCSWYHKRMLERKRATKTYNPIPGEDLDEEQDLELGETGRTDEEQETGVTAPQQPTVTEELDNWDENADEWDEDEPALADGANGGPLKQAEEVDSKKRDD